MHEHNEYSVQVYDEIHVALYSTISFNYVSYSVPLSSTILPLIIIIVALTAILCNERHNMAATC